MFKRVLLPIDLQHADMSSKAVAMAVKFAEENDAEIHIMSVLPEISSSWVAGFFPESSIKNALEEMNKKLVDYIDANIPESVTVLPHIAQGVPAEKIVDMANQRNIDLVLVPLRIHKRKLRPGYTATKVADKAPCHVLLVK